MSYFIHRKHISFHTLLLISNLMKEAQNTFISCFPLLQDNPKSKIHKGKFIWLNIIEKREKCNNLLVQDFEWQSRKQERDLFGKESHHFLLNRKIFNVKITDDSLVSNFPINFDIFDTKIQYKLAWKSIDWLDWLLCLLAHFIFTLYGGKKRIWRIREWMCIVYAMIYSVA